MSAGDKSFETFRRLGRRSPQRRRDAHLLGCERPAPGTKTWPPYRGRFRPRYRRRTLQDLPADRQAEPGTLRLVGERVAGLLEAFEDLSWSFSAMPMPLSSTSTRRKAASCQAPSRSRPFSLAQNFTALEIRFTITWVNRSASALTGEDRRRSGSRA